MTQNIEQTMQAVLSEMREIPALHARITDLEQDISAVLEAYDSGTDLPSALVHRMREVRERHAKRMRERLSAAE